MQKTYYSTGYQSHDQDWRAAQWEFLKAHPFGVDPGPYASGLPANSPSYCQIIQ
ncbi:MAG: hypothetical protein OEZ06_28305 [Myxococcales bacterium]|nr:hypothetical protein [Myxococcales bacterium]